MFILSPENNSLETGKRSQRLAVAQRQMRERELRANWFNSTAINENTWSILITLYMASIEGRQTTIEQACVSKFASYATMHRWLCVLESEGLARLSKDRLTISLTDPAICAIEGYLQEMAESDH